MRWNAALAQEWIARQNAADLYFYQEQAWEQTKGGDGQPEYAQQAQVAGNPAFGRNRRDGAHAFSPTRTETLKLLPQKGRET